MPKCAVNATASEATTAADYKEHCGSLAQTKAIMPTNILFYFSFVVCTPLVTFVSGYF